MRDRLLMTVVTVAVAIGIAGSVPAAATEDIDCENASSTVEMNYCGEQEYNKVDAELNALYRTILDGLSDQDNANGDTVGAWRDALRAAQRAWVSFKEKDCGELIGYEWGGGTGAGPATYGCLIQKTKSRIQELKDRYEAR